MLFEPNYDDRAEFECYSNTLSMSISMVTPGSNSSWVWNPQTMCCTGSESCRKNEISVLVNISQEFSNVDKTSGRAAVRCDAFDSCTSSQNITIDVEGNVCV